ncbi:hypothetical protein D910_07913, partial [Dendroctonus ponderosae]
MRRVGREDLLAKCEPFNIFVCTRHFHDLMNVWIKNIGHSDFKQMDRGEPANSEDPPIIDLAPQNVGSELLAKPAVTEYHMDIGVSSMDDQSKNNVVYELKTLANESNSTLLNEDHPVENLELPTDDTSLSINITSNLCRLCLENSPQMWNFFSIITLDDQSTIDVVVAFEKLTGEHVEEKYEKSSTILKSLLTENCESVEIVKSEESCTEDNETGHESVLIPESTTDFSIAVDDIQELSDDDVASSPQPEIEPQSVRKRKREEGNQTFQHRCNICNRIFLGRNHLKFHQLSHKKESPYKCEECGKGFFRQANFDYHKLSHTMSDDLPFKCKYCAKSYSNPEALKRHTFHHEKYKDSLSRHINQTHFSLYQCEYCSKTFASKWSLTAHEDTHTGQKEHVCNICGKTFTLKSSLNRHMTVH